MTVAAAREAGTSATRLLCAFRLGTLHLGVDVALVQEVTERLPLARVPHAPRGVRGVINLRGRVLTALDLPTLLALPAGHVDELEPVDLVLRHGEELVGLHADDVTDVVEVGLAAGRRPPANLPASLRDLLVAVHALDRRVLLELDIPALVAAVRRSATTPPSRESCPS